MTRTEQVPCRRCQGNGQTRTTKPGTKGKWINCLICRGSGVVNVKVKGYYRG